MIWLHHYMVDGYLDMWELAEDNDRGCGFCRECMVFMPGETAQAFLAYSARQLERRAA